MDMTDVQDNPKTRSKQPTDKTKRQRALRTLDGGTSPSDQKEITYKGIVLKAVDWDKLPTGSLFSTSPDGNLPKLKDSISSYYDIKFRSRITGIVGGTAYPVVL